jgi:hypothetical protein
MERRKGDTKWVANHTTIRLTAEALAVFSMPQVLLLPPTNHDGGPEHGWRDMENGHERRLILADH